MLIVDQLRKSEPQLRVLSLLLLFGVFTLLAGLWHVQVISSNRFQANLDSQSYRTIRVPAVRGQIFDRNGRILAANRASFTINIYLEDLRHLFGPEYDRLKTRKQEELGRKLSRPERAPLEPMARFNVINSAAQSVANVIQRPIRLESRKVNRHWLTRRALPMPIAENLTQAEVARFAETPFDHPGISLDSQLRRHYPHNETAAHVLGYLMIDHGMQTDIDTEFDHPMPGLRGGGTGVESVFDHYLRGAPGGKSVLVDHIGYRRNETMDQEPSPGDDLFLTIDLDIQKMAEEELAKVSPHVRGAVVVMNPRNGDVLALVSAPAFDPNRFPSVSTEYWNYNNDPTRAAFRCRATQDNFPPGSIFKIVVALACLEKGTMRPNEIYQNKGYITVGRPFKDTAPPGPYDFHRAFIRSSNSYFIHNGLEARVRTIIEMGNRFFLGQPTKIPTWQDYAGNFPKLESIRPGKWFDGDTANLCIGQGPIDMTPLQAAIMTSAVSNGGSVYWPRLVERVTPHKSRINRKSRFNPPGRARGTLDVRPKNLNLVVKAMLADVEDTKEGTGKRAAVPGMRIGGKTGTAEIKKRGVVIDKKTWFVSFGQYPGEAQPRYTVVVLVESGGSGGKTSAPVAGAIYRRLYERDKPSLQVADSLSFAN